MLKGYGHREQEQTLGHVKEHPTIQAYFFNASQFSKLLTRYHSRILKRAKTCPCGDNFEPLVLKLQVRVSEEKIPDLFIALPNHYYHFL